MKYLRIEQSCEDLFEDFRLPGGLKLGLASIFSWRICWCWLTRFDLSTTNEPWTITYSNFEHWNNYITTKSERPPTTRTTLTIMSPINMTNDSKWSLKKIIRMPHRRSWNLVQIWKRFFCTLAQILLRWLFVRYIETTKKFLYKKNQIIM